MCAFPLSRLAVMNKSAPSITMGLTTASSSRDPKTVKLPNPSGIMGQMLMEPFIESVTAAIIMLHHVCPVLVRD
eukprot:4783036-Karenia_brevis.AAC.1